MTETPSPFPWLAIPDLRAFVIARVTQMRTAPGMWAVTREGFGMQLAVLLEMATGLPAVTCTPIVFGKDGAAVVITGRLRDEWARERCEVVLERLQRTEVPR